MNFSTLIRSGNRALRGSGFGKVVLGLLLVASPFLVKGQTTYDWLNTAPDGNFRQGAAGARWNPGGLFDEPPYGIVQFNNNNQTTMTNNVAGTWSQFKFNFGSSATTGRTIGGNTVQFFDFGGTWPFIQNQSSASHTINFPILVGTGGTFNLELVANAGNLVFGGTLGNQGKNVLVYGNNTAIDGTNRSVRLGGITSGAGKLIVSQFGVAKLNVAHTYSGNTEIDNGELWIETGGSATSSAFFVGNGGQLGNVTKLWLANSTGGTTFSNSFTINNGNANTREIGGLNSSGTHTFSGAITNNSTTGGLSVNALSAGGTTTLSGVVSGGGAISTTGSGTVIISGASQNTYTNTFTAGAATTVFNKSADTRAIGTGNMTINTGVAVRTDANNQLGTGTPSLITINGTGVFNLNNTNQKIALASASTTSSVTLGSGTLNIDNAGTDTYAGTITGSGGLTKTGAGTQILSNTGNSYTGATTITGGILRLGAAGVIADASNVVMNGGTLSTGAAAGFAETVGTLSLTASSTIALGTGSHNLTFANSSATAFTAGTILTITGWTGTNNGNSSGTAGRIFVGNSAGGLTGLQLSRIRFNISSVLCGAMQLSTGEVVPTGGPVQYYGGATGTWTGNLWGVNELGPYTSVWVSGSHAIMNIASANTLTFATTNVAAITYNTNITFASGGTFQTGPSGGAICPIYVDATRTFTMAGQGIATAAGSGLIKLGTGTLQSTNGNTYPGGFTISSGTMVVGGVNAMGNGGALNLNGGTIGTTGARNITTRYTGINIGGDFTIGDATNNSTFTFADNVALGSSVTRTITLGAAATQTFNGIISGPNSNLVLAATAAGSLQLGGVNTYGGNTTINGGTLRTSVAAALPSTTNVTLANTAGANLDLVISNQTVASIAGGGSTGGNISLGATVAALTVNQSTNTTYSGLISGASTGGLIKTGSGILTLGHTANTYTGPTTITAGELRINPSTTTGSFASQVVLNGGKLSSTGITLNTVWTNSSTLKLDANSSVDLGSNVHELRFAASNAITWGAFTITVNGWTGTAGNSGATGRIFVGTTNGGLISGQLSKINFAGYGSGAVILSTGEIVPAAAPVSYTWTGGAADGLWASSGNWSPAGVPASADQVTIVTAGTNLNLADARTVNNAVFNGNFNVTSTGSLTVTGNVTYTSGTGTWDCASTFTMSSSSSQTIPAYNYGNLVVSGGARTLVNGSTTRVCGNYTPGTSTTVTGSTFEFNGTAAQAINTNAAAFATLNITNSSATVTANANVTASTAMTVGSGAIFNMASATTLNVSSATVLVTGTLRNSSGNSITQTSATVTINGTYDHNMNGGAVLSGTWGGSSNFLINTGATTALPASNLGQSFNDVTINAALIGTQNFGAALTTIGRDLIVNGTGSTIGLTATTAYAGTIGRNFTINAGNITLVTGNNTSNASLAVTGNVSINGGGLTVAGGSSSGTGTAALTVGGTFSNSSSTGTSFVLNGGSKTGVTATITGLYTQSGSGTSSLGQNTSGAATLTCNGGITISNGTFNVANGGPATLTVAAANTLTVSGGTLIGSATAHISTINANGNVTVSSGILTLANIASSTSNITMANNNTMTVSGSGTVNVAVAGIGNLNVGTSTSTVTTTALTINGGSLVIAGGGTGTVNSYADLNLTSGTMSRSTGTAVFNFLKPGVDPVIPGNHVITQSSGTISGIIAMNVGSGAVNWPLLTLGSPTINIGANTTLTVTANAKIDCGATNVLTGLTFTLATQGTLITANTAGITTGASGSIQTTNRNFGTLGYFIYNGTSAQVTGNAFPASSAIFSIFNSAGVTLTSSHTIFAGGQFILFLSPLGGFLDLAGNNLTIQNTATIVGASSSNYIRTSGAGRLIRTVGTSVLFPIGTSAGYNPLLLSSGTSDTYAVRVINGAISGNTTPNDITKTINRLWEVTEGTAGGTATIVAAYNVGEENNAGVFNAASQRYIGIANGPGVNSFSQVVTATGTTTFTASGSMTPTVASYFIGLGKDDGLVSPITTYTWTGLAGDNAWTSPNNWSPNTSAAGPTAIDHVIINIATAPLIISGSRTISNFELSGTGTFSMAASSTLTINGDLTYNGSSGATATFDCSSTLNITSSLSQPIPPLNYGNLNASGGARNWSSTGTIGICGIFTPGSSNNISTSTVNFNGAAGQTINAINYFNLTNSSNTTRTLGAGTIDIANSYTPTTAVTSPGTGTVNFSSASVNQTIPCSNYFNITNTGNFNRTLASTGANTNKITVAGTFTFGTGPYTIGTSTVEYTGTGYNLTAFTYYNAIFNGSGIFSLSGNTITVNNNFNATAGTVIIGSSGGNGILNVNGTLTIDGGTLNTTNTTTAGTINLLGNFGISAGTMTKSGSGTGTVNFIHASNPQTFNQSGGTISNANNWNFGNGSVANTVQFTSNVSASTGVFNVNSGTTVDLGSNQLTVTSGTFNLNSGASFITTNAAGILAGATAVSGSILRGASSSFSFNTGANYTFGGANTGTGFTGANNLTINNASNVTLTSSATVSGTLTFSNGILILGTNTLTANGSVSGAGATRYVRTSGTGRLIKSVSSSPVLFEVGNSAYNPITIANSGTSDVLGIAVADAISQTLNNSSNVVNRSWTITEGTAGGSNLAVTTQWNSPGEEAAGFTAGYAAGTKRLAVWTGSNWTQVAVSFSGAGTKTFSTSTNFLPATLTPGTYTIAAGIDDAFICTAPPTITSFLPTSAYAGDAITITGTGLTGLTVASIGGINATIGTQSGTSVVLTVGPGASGNIILGTNALCTATSSGTFTFSGFISTQSGPWGTGATWRGGNVPTTPGATVVIDATHNVSSNVASNPASITVNSTGTLTLTNSARLGTSGSTAVVVNGTLTCPVSVLSASNGMYCNTLTINNGGIFNNNAGNADAISALTFTVNAGGTYNHDAVSSSTNANTFDMAGGTSGNFFDADAIVNITKWGQTGNTPTAPFPTSATGTYGNLTISITGQVYTGAWNIQGGITNTKNFTIVGTGSRELRIFTNAVGGTLNVSGDMSVTGGITALLNSGSTCSGSCPSAVLNVSGNFSLSGGTFDLTGTSGNSTTGNTTINLFGNCSISGAGQILRTTANSGTNAIRFVKSGGQTFSTTAAGINTHVVNINIGAAASPALPVSTVQMLSNIPMNSAATMTVFQNATLDARAERTVTGGTFTMNTGGQIRIGSQQGIVSAASGSPNNGNIRTTTRNYNGGGNYSYCSFTNNQATGDGLPATITGVLKIDNSGAASNNTVTLTTVPTTTTTLTLDSGFFAAGLGGTLNIAAGGTVIRTATGTGDFATGSSAGTINFNGAGSFSGSSNPYNVTINTGAVSFGADVVTIQNGGTFQINGGNVGSSNPPYYAVGSTLRYNTGYGRFDEWNATSGRGYPHHVRISAGTFDLGNGGSVNRQCGGNLTIDDGTTLTMSAMTNSLTVLGNVTMGSAATATLTLSSAGGGDLYVGGNWTRNATSTLNTNNREVIFNGTAAQSFTGVTTFDYIRMNNNSTGLTLNNNMIVNQRLQIDDGQIILGTNNITLNGSAFVTGGGASDFIVTNSTGVLSQPVVNGEGDNWFPVGPSTNIFGPVTLNNTGAGTDNISVRVRDIRANALPIYTNLVNDTTQMVKLEWFFNEGTAGGNNIRTTFGWQGAGTAGAGNIEGSAFDRTSGVYHGNHNGTKYVVRAANATSGTNPWYSLSTVALPYTGNLSNQAFVVGNINGILPCFQSLLAGDWNTATNWVDLSVPPLDATVCLNHAMTLASAPPNPSGITINAGGSVAINNGVTLTLEPNAFFTNSSGSFKNMTTGTIQFSGLAVVNGANAIGFNNLQLEDNTTFTTTPTINNELEILPGGFVISTGSVNYGASSTLKYNTGGPYSRSNEWRATSGAGYPANVLVTGNTSLNLDAGTGVNRMIQGNMQIDNGSSATQGATGFNLTVPGNFTLNGGYTQSTTLGGDLVLGGNWSSAATASLTANNRDVRFNGTSSTQTIANLASGLQFGFLTVDNTTVGGVDLLNTITANTFRVNASRTFSLTSDKIIISPGGNVQINGTFNAGSGTIEYTNGGNFTNDGTFNRGTSTVDFLSTTPGVVVGSVQTNFHNLRLAPSGSVNFNSGALRGRVSGTLQMRAGSFCIGNAPIYEAGSKLMYSGGGTFNRNVEWDPTTLQKVEVTNNTTLKCGPNGTGFSHVMADSLIIQSGSTFDMSGPDMTAPTVVGGNVHLRGTLTLSNTGGGDLEVAGDWQNDGGTFNSNGRLTTFNGSSNGSIKGSSNTTFSFLTVNKGINKTLTASVPFTISRPPGGTTLQISGGVFDLNGQTLSLGSGSNTLRIDAGFINGQTLRTGGTSITAFSNFRSTGANTDTLGGKVDYSGSGAETLISPVKGYNLLWITGGSTKTISQNTRVNDSLWIAPSTTLDFGASASILESRGNVVNNGSTIGSGTGKIELKGLAVQNMSGNGTYRNLDVNNTNNVNSTGTPTISSKLNVVSGKILQASASDSITLGSIATITEVIGGGEHFVRGKLSTTRTVGTAAETFGGMGIELTAGANLGTVTATRQSGIALTGTASCCSGFTSINRNWVIKPSVQPSLADRNLTLTWQSEDDNAMDMTNLQLWKRSSTASPWESIDATQDVSLGNPRSASWTGVSSFSQFTGADLSNPLPLGLISLSGKNENGNGLLTWRVENGTNHSIYKIYKSTDEKNFSEIGLVVAKENNNQNLYQFTDKDLKKDSYYRIQLVQKDGKAEVSQTVAIRTDAFGKPQIRMYPNPTSGGARILMDGNFDNEGMVSFEIFGMDGKANGKLAGEFNEVNQKFENFTSTLPAGMYQVKVTSADQVKTLKLIKK